MDYYLDTADLSAIRKILEVFPIDGVTTNPSILAQENRPPLDQLREIQRLIGSDKQLFAQVIAGESEGMIRQGSQLLDEVSDQLIIKIPVSLEGLKAIQYFHQQNVKTLATAIFTSQQGMWASKAGAAYLAPYVTRIDNMSSDGIAVTQELLQIIDHYHFNTKVVAASFKNVKQVQQLSAVGCHAATLAPDVLEASFGHEGTVKSLEGFEHDWKKSYQTLDF